MSLKVSSGSGQKGCLILSLNFRNPPLHDHPLDYVLNDQNWANWKETWFLNLLYHLEIGGTLFLYYSIFCHHFKCMEKSRLRYPWYFGNLVCHFLAKFPNWLGILKNYELIERIRWYLRLHKACLHLLLSLLPLNFFRRLKNMITLSFECLVNAYRPCILTTLPLYSFWRYWTNIVMLAFLSYIIKANL